MFVVLMLAVKSLNDSKLCIICRLVLQWPILTVGVRRMVDTKQSGRFLLFPDYNIVLLSSATKCYFV